MSDDDFKPEYADLVLDTICSPEFIESAIKGMMERCDEARMAGGIAKQDVVNLTRTVPENWWFDDYTCYYLPPGFQFSEPKDIEFQ